MELTNELKLLLIKTGPHKDAQTVIDNIEDTVEIDTEEAWDQRYKKYIKDQDLEPDHTAAELKASLEANEYAPVEPIPIWKLEKYASEADYDAKLYARNRKNVYPDIGDQLDTLWHAIDENALDKTSDFYTAIKAVKDANPKLEE